MEDLRECPCCGAPGKLKSVKAYVGFMRGWVGCPACGLYIHWAHDPSGAIRKWNTREPGKKERIATGPAAPRNDTEGEAAAGAGR